METFLEWARNRFTMVSLMHLTDVDNKTFKEMMFENGPSRDEFIKCFVYKLLLNIDPESENSQKHNLEKIFVTFGLLDKEVVQQFLKGNLSPKLHIATWKRLMNAIIPTTMITPHCPSYDDLINNIHEKNDSFRLARTKKYLPPELMAKLKVQGKPSENCESIEDIVEELTKLIKKPLRFDENSDDKIPLDCDVGKQNSSIPDLKPMDIGIIQKEIDHYVKISNENKITLSTSEHSPKIPSEVFTELIKNTNLLDTDCIESKMNSIYTLLKAEQDLQTLTNSLANQT